LTVYILQLNGNAQHSAAPGNLFLADLVAIEWGDSSSGALLDSSSVQDGCA